jgi:hypothetical protein
LRIIGSISLAAAIEPRNIMRNSCPKILCVLCKKFLRIYNMKYGILILIVFHIGSPWEILR